MQVNTGNGTRQIMSDGLAAKQIPFTDIPVIDFAAMQSGDRAERQQVADQLCQSCIQVGFFYVKNHGVSQTVIDQAFAQAQRFFALPLEEKMKIHISHSPNHRGYVPLLEENTDPTAKGDLHEAIDFALEVAADDPDVLAGKVLYGPNVYPENLPGFRQAIEQYYWELYDLGRKIFQAFALALDLPEDYFEQKITKPLAQMRLLRYPPQTGTIDDKQIGTGAHSDYECFTILMQDEVGGLQVLNSAGEWIAAVPIPGTFVVNIGDQMARWTNNLFSSTVHRAINQSKKERFSIPYFFGPNYDTLVEALPNCVNSENPAQYQPITTGEYILSRFNETFAYRVS
ncbi:MAG TPA: 2-oxoglutarate and iron-dependent oxygenase domain-containing protein [Coleofasciculaceae cyanobacterium]